MFHPVPRHMLIGGASLLAMVAVGGPAQSLVVTTAFSGDTTGQPTWQRPVFGGPSLSTNCDECPFQVFPFTVTAAGPYTITTQTDNDYDGYLHLYDNTGFDPLNPLQGLLAGDDDFGGSINASQIADVPLSSGQGYFIVQSGFDNNDFGPFTGTIEGPGAANFNGTASVPAPLPLFGAAAAFVTGRRLRQRITRGKAVPVVSAID